jgi:hypothetical protein
LHIVKRALRRVVSDERISSLKRALSTLNTDRRTANRNEWIIRYSETIHGGANSVRTGLPCDKDGKPIPWFTFSSIEFLSQLDLSQCKVFEYGSGNGSRYWASRCCSVVSVENAPEWHRFGSEMLAPNQTLLLRTDPGEYVSAVRGTTYDIIVVDGEYRYDCAAQSVHHLSKHGLIILDNSDWHPNTCALLAQHRLIQVDFAGPGPINSYAWCTSLFFSRDFALPRKSAGPFVLDALVQVGGHDKQFSSPQRL